MSTRSRASARQKQLKNAKKEDTSIKEEIEVKKEDSEVQNQNNDCKADEKEQIIQNDEQNESNNNEVLSANDHEDEDENKSKHDGDDEKEMEETKLSKEDFEEAKEFNKNITKLNTKEMEMEDLLNLKIKLKDGKENFLFSRGPKYSDEKWSINCHLCRMGNLFSIESLRQHLKGRSHFNKLIKNLPIPKYYNEPFFTSVPKEFEKEHKPIKIYAGETIAEITDEYKDRVVSPEEFAVKEPTDEKLLRMLQKEHLHEYNSRMPLLGLCYIYKMMGFRGVTYYCTLCYTKIEEEAYQHIVGCDHQSNYIVRHFPKLYEKIYSALKEIRGIDQIFCLRNIFRKLYRKIENIKGLRKITICDDEDFFKNKKRYLLKTRFDEHYDEDSIMFTDHEIEVLIRKCKNDMQFIKPDLISLENPQLGFRMTSNDERAGEQIFNDMNHRGDGGYDNYSGGYGGDMWYNYFQVLEREVEDLNIEYRNYDRFPRKHPKYERELNKYNNFKKEGASEKDKKESNTPWNMYWKRRLRALYDNDLTKRKQRIKRQLGLRLNARTPSPPRRSFQNFGMQGYANFCNNEAAVAGLRELMSIMSNQPQYNNYYDNYPGNYNRNGNFPPAQVSKQNDRNTNLGVIAVLRMFSALEGQLGSLGPQAIQLLSRAVIVEKNGQNPNDLMMEKEFYIFFVAAQEKLKVQYISNSIPNQLMGAVKSTIHDCSILIEMFEDYCKRSGKKLPDVAEQLNINSNLWKSDLPSTSSNFNDNDDFFIGGNTGVYENAIGGSGNGNFNKNQLNFSRFN